MHKAHILQTWSPMSRPAGHLEDHNMSGQELGWNFCFARFPRPSFASHLNAMVVGQLRFLLELECVKVFFLERCLKWSGPILDQSRRLEETVGSGATVAPPRSQGHWVPGSLESDLALKSESRGVGSYDQVLLSQKLSPLRKIPFRLVRHGVLQRLQNNMKCPSGSDWKATDV